VFRRRTILLAITFSLGFTVLAARLVDLQLLQGSALRQQGLQRIHRLQVVPPRRGRIKDRQGRIVAEDVPSYDLWLVPAGIRRQSRGTYVVDSLVPGFTVPRILRMARSSGGERDLDGRLALRDLEEGNPLIDALVPLLADPGENEAACRKRLAQVVLDALRERNADSEEALTRPRPCFEHVSQKAYLAVEQARVQADTGTDDALTALEARIGTQRVYPYGALLGHITGYVGRLSEKEYCVLRGYWDKEEATPGLGIIRHRDNVFFSVLPDPDDPADADGASVEMEIIRLVERRRAGRVERFAGYLRNEMVGRSGVEQYYNQTLRGRHACRYLRLDRPDPHGPRVLTAVGTRGQVKNGTDIALTIDLDVQRKVRDTLRVALAGPQGAAEEERFRHLLGPAQLNSPAGIGWERHRDRNYYRGVCVLMNPTNGRIYALVSYPDFDPNRLHEDFRELHADPRQPLYNHAIAGEYPPGSVFKPVVGLGALMEGSIGASTQFDCAGEIFLGTHRYICMHRAHHGPVDVRDALMLSCNIFFYHAAEALGPRRLYSWAWGLGLGHRTEVDLAGERPGHLPHEAYTGRGWAKGNTYHIGIGQGPITVTPLQMAVAFSAIANGGRIVQPHVVHGDPALDQPRAELGLDPEHLRTIREGLWRVVQGPEDTDAFRHGTAERAGRIPGLEYAGKTGSAEWQKSKDTHAWFACYAPFEKPEVVCVVLVPEGKYGGSTCAPIARRILMDFFDIQETEEDSAIG